MDASRKSFAEMLDETDASRQNSNIQNLALAHVAIREELDRMELERQRLEAIQREIEKAGEYPETLTLERTKELYAKACRR